MPFLEKSCLTAKKAWLKHLLGTTQYQKILRIYALIIIMGAFLLWMPFSQSSGSSGSSGRMGIFDSFFTAVSAFTNTGLTIKPTSETFNFFGQLVILILIQAGGMGFLTILIFLWTWIRKGSYSVEQRRFLHLERGSYKRVESLPVVKTGIIFLLITEAIGFFLLTIFFYVATPLTVNGSSGSSPDFKGNILKSMWAGLFHSVSAANNAGFDIIGKHSIIPFRADGNNFLSLVLLVESIIGGIGYPVFYDFYIQRKNKKNNIQTDFSLFSKIAVNTYLWIAVIALTLALLFETIISFKFDHSLFKCSGSACSHATAPSGSANYGWGTYEKVNKIWNLMYLTFSSRSSGFTSIDTNQLTEPTKWLLSIMMFIGASPASTGGGIRTITIFIIFARMWYTFIGKEHLSVYSRTIDQKIVFESCNVFIVSTILIIISAFVLLISSNTTGVTKLSDVIFESASAFGTTGLSSGISEKSNFLGKLVLMSLMFVGQLGVSNALISFTDQKPKQKNLIYCSENLRIV